MNEPYQNLYIRPSKNFNLGKKTNVMFLRNCFSESDAVGQPAYFQFFE